MRKCCLFVHTGRLESFHSMKLQYLPKSAGFEMEMSVILTMLAVLQNNEYITQEVNAKVYNLKAWSRASKAYVLKKRTIYDKVSFWKAILKEVEDNIASRTLLPLDLSSYIRTRRSWLLSITNQGPPFTSFWINKGPGWRWTDENVYYICFKFDIKASLYCINTCNLKTNLKLV